MDGFYVRGLCLAIVVQDFFLSVSLFSFISKKIRKHTNSLFFFFFLTKYDFAYGQTSNCHAVVFQAPPCGTWHRNEFGTVYSTAFFKYSLKVMTNNNFLMKEFLIL